MFEKIGRYAEALATSACTRRGFLARLGKGAMGVAGLVGGLLLFPRGCGYDCPDRGFVIRPCPIGGVCPRTIKDRGRTCTLVANDCG
jgi:hypothetical protein